MLASAGTPVLRREQVRALDRRCIEELGMPGILLMEHAALGLADAVQRFAPGRVSIVCGKGNNGGDGFALARLLARAGRPLELLLAFDPHTLAAGDARLNYELACRLGLPMRRLSGGGEADLRACQLLVDAVFGTGLQGRVRAGDLPLLQAMARVARRGVPTLAVDIPSGLDANTGRVLGACVPAQVTVSFAAAKTGFYLREGPVHCGRIEVVDIGIPRAWIEAAAEESSACSG